MALPTVPTERKTTNPIHCGTTTDMQSPRDGSTPTQQPHGILSRAGTQNNLLPEPASAVGEPMSSNHTGLNRLSGGIEGIEGIEGLDALDATVPEMDSDSIGDLPMNSILRQSADDADLATDSPGPAEQSGWRKARRASVSSVRLMVPAHKIKGASVSPTPSRNECARSTSRNECGLKFCRSSTVKGMELQAAATCAKRLSDGEVVGHVMAMTAASRASRSARQELQEFAEAPLPSRRGTFGPTIYLFVTMLRVPLHLTGLTRLCSPFYGALVRLGGVERVYVLLTIARFDPDNSGNIDEKERQTKGQEMVQDAASTCSSMSVVSSLMIGLSHLQAIGRPDVWEASPDFLEYYGEEAAEQLLGAVHAVNALTEALYAPGTSNLAWTQRASCC